MAKTRHSKRTALGVYKTYSFVNKDPIIDKLRTAFQDEAKDAGIKESSVWKTVEEQGGPKAATFRNWFRGDTKRPQFAAVAATAIALGYEIDLVKKVHRLRRRSAG